MICSTVLEKLSAFHDGELADNTAVSRHLRACPTCHRELALYEGLSRLVRRLPNPTPPPDLWQAVVRRLECDQAATLRERPWQATGIGLARKFDMPIVPIHT